MADIIELDQVPFGNHYFSTTTCGGAPYDSEVRHCWAKRCIGKSPPGDCFKGEVVNQHGEAEEQMDRLQACAKSQNTSWQEYWPMLQCSEEHYKDGVDFVMKSCVHSSGIDGAALKACYEGPESDVAFRREAMKTFDHPGAPWILVAGQPMESPSAASLIQAICAAYEGTPPGACRAKAFFQ